MGYWDYYKGALRDYHRDPFPHSLLRTRDKKATAPEAPNEAWVCHGLSKHERKIEFDLCLLLLGPKSHAKAPPSDFRANLCERAMPF